MPFQLVVVFFLTPLSTSLSLPRLKSVPRQQGQLLPSLSLRRLEWGAHDHCHCPFHVLTSHLSWFPGTPACGPRAGAGAADRLHAGCSTPTGTEADAG